MDIGEAIKQMRDGRRVQRAGWNGVQAGKNMWLGLQLPDEHSKMTQPYVYMFTNAERGTFVPWLCSQSDLLATDWNVVE